MSAISMSSALAGLARASTRLERAAARTADGTGDPVRDHVDRVLAETDTAASVKVARVEQDLVGMLLHVVA
jgi:hypothetical protein